MPADDLPPAPSAARAVRAIAAAALTAGAVLALRIVWDLGQQPWAHVDVGDPVGWLARTPAETAVAAVVRWMALATIGWGGAAVALGVAARLVRWRAAIRTMDRVSPRTVRCLAERLVGAALLTSAGLGPVAPAMAAPPLPPPAAGPVGGRHGGGAPPADQQRPRPPGVPAPVPPRRTTDAARGREVVVRRGDHLWRLAVRELRRSGRHPDVHEVAAYWRRVVERNRDRIASGDPDLIVPGEVVVLPPVEP